MDEEVGVRMTRLRRRLSVEQSEEVSSPATPTKKRAGKLAKLVLDNIAENAVVESPKRATRRSIAMENAGGDQAAVGTPDKKTRGKVNTSLSESIQGIDSPRAARVTRRNSVAGNDSEVAALTPVRRSRRISKDTYSPEAAAEIKHPGKRSKRLSAAAPDVIVEEVDKDEKNESVNSQNKKQSPVNKASSVQTNNIISEESSPSDKSSPGYVRKSPRLSLKKNTSIMLEEDNDVNFVSQNKKIEETSKSNDSKQNSASKSKNKFTLHVDKMSPNVLVNLKGIKKRSKSFTVLEKESKNDSRVYYSDNENRKSRSQKKVSPVALKLESEEIGDHRIKSVVVSLTRNETPLKIKDDKEREIQENINVRNGSSNNSNSSFNNISGIDVLEISKQQTSSGHDGSKTNQINCHSATQSEQITKISSTIIMEDSDGNDEKISPKEKENNSHIRKIDDSCEPMDVDETLPEYDLNTSGQNMSNNTNTNDLKEINDNSVDKLDNGKSFNKSLSNNVSLNDINSIENNSTINKSVRDTDSKTSSASKTFKQTMEMSEVVEKSSNERKSTLLFSPKTVDSDQKKNTSYKNEISKSKSFDINMNKESLDKKNISLTSNVSARDTPIRNKIIQKIGVFTSTPVQSNHQTNNCTLEHEPKNEGSKVKVNNSTTEHEDRLSDEEPRNKSKLVDDEAESAGDNYESGDSQDESEREYAEQNAIPTKGETLDSDEDIGSDDSDYEKDSFVVSSNEEDDELLSGSGDDLSDSDNELKMSSKSKEKYNKRKAEIQKKASREMFEARHGKSNSACNIGSEDSDDPDIVITNKNKKRNRLRLDSSKDVSDGKVCDEQEITIIDNNSKSDIDPLMNGFPIKQEVTDVSRLTNTMLEEIENVDVDQNVTMFSNKDTKNPLLSFNCGIESSDSESSDDGGIADNYNSLLVDLNKSKDKNRSQNVSQTDNKQSTMKRKSPFKENSLNLSKEINNKQDSSLIGNLNLTESHKAKNINDSKQEKTKGLTSGHNKSDHEDKISSDLSESYKTNKKENTTINRSCEQSALENSKQNEKEFKHLRPSSDKHLDISGSESRKKNVSLTEYDQASKQAYRKENSVLHKINLSNSGKEKNTKINKQSKDDKSNNFKSNSVRNEDESSSDNIDFKLLFTQDDDSNDSFIPLKKSEAKTNLLHNTEVLKTKDQSFVVTEEDGNAEVIAKSNGIGNKSLNGDCDDNSELVKGSPKKKKNKGAKSTEVAVNGSHEPTQPPEKSRKRKREDVQMNNNKVYVTGAENNKKVQRLPKNIIDRLEEKPHIAPKEKKTVTSTSHFDVQTVVPRKNKPSQYLEESIYIDKSPKRTDKDVRNMFKQPKVLPSLPSASTSSIGFTSNFKVNILKPEQRHDAKLAGPDCERNFKTQRLYGSNIKRIATEELCRKQKRIKITKF